MYLHASLLSDQKQRYITLDRMKYIFLIDTKVFKNYPRKNTNQLKFSQTKCFHGFFFVNNKYYQISSGL